ncbi:hypothetical protein ACIPSA_15085 [Streptomyces sp. NPDC086549]|uniref:hypothetical protein n=1 Tax=Streptomyces sp. NPDC086549 TaxID=3365752 RepID=UPI0037FD3055
MTEQQTERAEQAEQAEQQAEVPPQVPPLPEGQSLVLPPVDAVRPAKDRRVLRAALRWTAAVVVFAAVGAGTAYGITRVERTDLPGLATESDGRWEYPELVKPPLPDGRPGPFAGTNKSGSHYADLRELVLPAPKGATADGTLRGTDGWLATKDFLAQYTKKEDREELGQQLTDYGLRHIAARGWTTQDGTRTRIYLLQFGTATVADKLMTGDLTSYDSPNYVVRGADSFARDEKFPDAARLADVAMTPYAETKPYGAEQVRQAYLTAGDTLAVIVQSRKGTAPTVPFQQTVTLQSQLLG